MKVKHKRGENKVHFILGERTFERKALALLNYKGHILQTLSYKRKTKPKAVLIHYKWGYSKGKKIKHTTVNGWPERPEYYYTSVKFPIGSKINQNNLLDFTALDLLEKYEYYAQEREYDNVHNLRQVTYQFFY